MRLFVAVWPPGEVVEGLQRLPRPEVGGVRWTSSDKWHVTLEFLGEVADPEQTRARFRSISAQRALATAGPRTEMLNKSVLSLPVTGMEALASRVATSLGELGSGRDRDRGFTGHLTLARLRRRTPAKVLRSLAGEPFSGSWQVEEVTLVSSTASEGGSRYEVLETLALAPSA